MYLVINKCVTAVKVSNFSGHYLRNRSTLDIVFWVISVYFNIRNTLPKSGTFLLGHPVYHISYSFVHVTVTDVKMSLYVTDATVVPYIIS